MGQKPTKETRTKMFLSALAEEFRAYLASSSLAITTRRNYRCRVDRFVRSFPPDATLPNLTRPTIARYLSAVAKDAPASVPMAYAAIHAFCLWLLREGWIRADPCLSIPLPKAQKHRRMPVPDDAIPRLLSAVDRLPRSDYKRELARAALSLLVYGALRASELSSMRVEDINLQTGEVYVRRGKGGKTRSLYVCKECLDSVREYLKVRIECDHDFLLAQNKRWGMQPYALRTLLRDLQRVAGITEHYTPHQLRHACASRLLHNGAPITAIQQFLGHSRPEITFRYLHGNEEQLRQIAHLTSLNPQKPEETLKTAPIPTSAKQEGQKRFRVRRMR